MFFKRRKEKAKLNPAVFHFQDIAADGYFEFSGLAIIDGDIGAGAKIKITSGGGILIRGNVGDNVNITVEQHLAKGSFVIIRKGDKPYSDQKFHNSVIVEGHCGHHVNIEAPGDIHVQDAGDHFMADAGLDFSGKTIGDNNFIESGIDLTMQNGGTRSILVAGHDVKTGNLGDNSEVSAGLDATLGDIGANSEVETGHDLKAQCIGAHSKLKSGLDMDIHALGHKSRAESGHDFTADLVGPKCAVKAGLDLSAKKAFNNATLKAAFDPEIGEYLNPESDSNVPRKTTSRNYDIM